MGGRSSDHGRQIKVKGTRPINCSFLREHCNGEARFLWAGLLLRERPSLFRRNLLVGIDSRKGLSVVTALEGEGLGRRVVDSNGLTGVQAKPHATG